MQFVEVINSSLDEYFPEPNMSIMAEPGRYFVTSAMTLATQIQSKIKGTSLQTAKYYINDGTYGSFNRSLYIDVEPKPLMKVIRFLIFYLLFLVFWSKVSKQ